MIPACLSHWSSTVYTCTNKYKPLSNYIDVKVGLCFLASTLYHRDLQKFTKTVYNFYILQLNIQVPAEIAIFFLFFFYTV